MTIKMFYEAIKLLFIKIPININKYFKWKGKTHDQSNNNRKKKKKMKKNSTINPFICLCLDIARLC